MIFVSQIAWAAMIDMAAFGRMVKIQNVPDGSLGVGAGSAGVRGNFRGFIPKGIHW